MTDELEALLPPIAFGGNGIVEFDGSDERVYCMGSRAQGEVRGVEQAHDMFLAPDLRRDLCS